LTENTLYEIDRRSFAIDDTDADLGADHMLFIVFPGKLRRAMRSNPSSPLVGIDSGI
jgi:hypothetical protein